MSDPDIYSRINELSAEEEHLYASAGDGSGLTEEETERLAAIKVELDRCFDLLHQRDGRRLAGLPEADARLRSSETVERYQQ